MTTATKAYQTNRRNQCPFHAWTERTPALDSRRIGLTIGDVDNVLYRHLGGYNKIMVLETKRGTAQPDNAQVTLYRIVDAVFRAYDGKQVKGYGTAVPLQYYGAHWLQMVNGQPDNGPLIWNGLHAITELELIAACRFELPQKGMLVSSAAWLG